MSVIKKMIKIPTDKNQPEFVCLQYIPKKGKVTLGGSNKLRELIWRIYMVCFEECDGEPFFYEVTRGKTRIDFNTSFKKLQEAYANIIDEGYSIEDIEAFGRLM